MLFGSDHQVSHTSVTTKHLVSHRSVDGSKWRSFFLSILCLIGVLVQEWIVVSLLCSHQVQSRDSLLGITWDAFLNSLERASSQNLVFSLVNFSVLKVDLDLMERVLSHSSGVDNESSLGDASNFFLNALLVVVIVSISACCWENWVWLADNFKWLEFTFLADGHKSPIIETTFPELSKVKVNVHLDVVDLCDVPLFNLVPCQQVVVVAIDRRWSSKS